MIRISYSGSIKHKKILYINSLTRDKGNAILLIFCLKHGLPMFGARQNHDRLYIFMCIVI